VVPGKEETFKIVKKDHTVPDFDLLGEFLERFYPRLKPETDPNGLYLKCKEAISFDFKRSKEFFCPLYDDPNCDFKKYAFFWLCWAESLFKLASFSGVEMALSQALRRHVEPFDVVQEYIKEYFPRKCVHGSQMLKLGLNMEDCSNVPNNINTLESTGLFDAITFTPGYLFKFEPDVVTPSTSSTRNKSRLVISLTPSKFSIKSIGNPQRITVDSLTCSDDGIIKNLEDSFIISQSDIVAGSLPIEANSSESVIETVLMNTEDTENEKDNIQEKAIMDTSVESTPCEEESSPQSAESDLIQVNPVEFLRSADPTLSAKGIIKICKAIQPEDQLENFQSEEFNEIDPDIFDKEDDDTRKSLRRYSIVKFTSSSLYSQLRKLKHTKYSKYFGSTTISINQQDPTPVRRSKRLLDEAKTPSSKSPWRN